MRRLRQAARHREDQRLQKLVEALTREAGRDVNDRPLDTSIAGDGQQWLVLGNLLASSVSGDTVLFGWLGTSGRRRPHANG
jgi:hypothetical protein